MQLVFANLVFFALGLSLTLELAVVTLIGSTVIGVVFGGIATIDHPLPKFLVRAYVNVLRGIPLIVNVLFVYFIAPVFGLSLNSFVSASVSLSLRGGANCAEIVRGGLQAVPRGQREARARWRSRRLSPSAKSSCRRPCARSSPRLPACSRCWCNPPRSARWWACPNCSVDGGIVVERAVIETGATSPSPSTAPCYLTYLVVCSALTRLTRGLERRYDPQHRATLVLDDASRRGA